MGWWGHDVLEGDGPMDLSFAPSEGETFSAFAERVQEYATKWQISDAIAIQVAGYIAMCNGIPLTEDDKSRILFGVEHDEWAKTSWERKAAMDQFGKAVQEYDGTPWEPTSRGLFEVMEEVAETMPGERVLVNVGPEVNGLRSVGDES